ncbi:rCG34200 [Rattus norvegicus]|uniref:RCG34200 n=1 Tax=Rattus norvegicus TaxID=10116 RepID=A6HHZ7_RAT|nr:rCG34200 [Rattus norvegicus]
MNGPSLCADRVHRKITQTYLGFISSSLRKFKSLEKYVYHVH